MDRLFSEFKHRIRDPIYGYIWLTDSELKIIDTPIFQRLRRVGQLALTKYVYPTAEHTRFVHSLGVIQASTNIFNEVLRFNPELKDDDLVQNLKTMRFAALLHDIGHMPFSHAAEKFFLGDSVTHEDIGKLIIETHPVISSEIKSNGINPKSVSSLLKGKCTSKLAILKKFISDEFDADRADYLLRDSYFCGVKYGEYDYIRYAGAFRLVEIDGRRRFAIEKGSLHAVEAFLLARYHYNLQVPFHRTRTGYDIVLKKYFHDLKERNALPDVGLKEEDGELGIDFEPFQLLDDNTIFELIKKDYISGNQWAKILMRQDRLHPIFDSEKVGGSKNDNDFWDMQNDLKTAGLKKDEDYFDFRNEIKVHKIFEKSDEGGEDIYPVVDRSDGNKVVGTILDFSSLLGATQKNNAYIGRIYVTSEAKSKAEAVLRTWARKIEDREKLKKGGA